MKISNVYLPDIIGRGYKDFWNFRGRYRVVKGSRASKKSKTTALWLIYNMMKHPAANALVIRKTYSTLKGSCFSDLQWAARRLGVFNYWGFKQNPLEATYRPTGQKILFRGLDDPMKITSISVPIGALCWFWIEEAYEISDEADFNTLDESIRGIMPPGLFKQATLTLNPWNDKHWIKRRFFDILPDNDVLAMTTTYHCNEWLDDSDRKLFEDMQRMNPRRYTVAGLGEWGAVDGLIYENWKEQTFDIDEILICGTNGKKRRGNPDIVSAFGLDFGYTVDPSALFCGLVNKAESKIYVFDELYERGLTNAALFKQIRAKGYAKEHIIADSAEPKSIDELESLGLYNIAPARKGRDSVANGIQYIQNFEIIIHPQCVNFLREIANYTWVVDRSGTRLNVPSGYDNHLMDAMRYAMEGLIEPSGFSTEEWRALTS